MNASIRPQLWLLITLIAAIWSGGFATSVSAQQPVILSFETDGSLTWSNAYSDPIAWVERLTDVVTTGSAVTVTETIGISDGSTAVYNYTVEHPPIVNPSVTVADGTYSWNDQTGASFPADFLGTVSSYESGRVFAVFLSSPAAAGEVIEVEYSYLPVSTHQEWLRVYSVQPPSAVTQATVDMSEYTGLLRVVNDPGPMVLIPGGSNSGTNPLGSNESHDSCLYPATYSLSVGPFYMDRYEVTWGLWEGVKDWYGGNGYTYEHTGTGKGWEHPVTVVNWYDCVKWCNARSQREGRRPVYYTDVGLTQVYKTGRVEPFADDAANGYRLPTSEEWDYAARGGLVSKRFPWGDTISHSQANYSANNSISYDLSSGGHHPAYAIGGWPYSSPVGSFQPNAYGLYDMAGNVIEWCADLHPCSGGSARVFRGGSWADYADNGRLAFREGAPGGLVDNDVGFRAVLSLGQ